MPDTAPQGSTTLYYDGNEHGCITAHGQCYWTDQTIAQIECSQWPDCKFLYESDKHSPATLANPIFWARGDGDPIREDGATLWKEQGNQIVNNTVECINTYRYFFCILTIS